ncbi:MAG: NmrA family NAD(P)-binding protein, partial [Planctomycetota bacterium]
MKSEINQQSAIDSGTVLVLGGTGKTGRRIVRHLKDHAIPVRIGSRSASIPFDWNNDATWDANLQGIHAVYISYTPDLAIPGAVDSISAFVDKAKRAGVKKLVLLSGRGEAEAQACEKIVLGSGIAATVVRASWFNQNFSEGAFFSMVESGQITLPVGEVREPFVDVDDIAEVAFVALTQDGHDGEIYEVTGPRLMSFDDIASELSDATGRPIQYVQIR